MLLKAKESHRRFLELELESQFWEVGSAELILTINFDGLALTVTFYTFPQGVLRFGAFYSLVVIAHLHIYGERYVGSLIIHIFR